MIPPQFTRRRSRSLGGWFSNFWRERLTVPGRSVMIGAAVSGIAIAIPEQAVGTLAFSFFAGLTIVALGLALVRPKVTAQRMLSDRIMAGEPATLTIRVRNATRRTLLDIGSYEFRVPSPLRLMEEPQYVDRLRPGESYDFRYHLLAPTRGHYLLPGPTALSAFPFALTQSKRGFSQPHKLVVYPRFRALRRLHLTGAHRYQPGGVALLSRVGESMEFVGNRDYRFGDRVRDLHPRSWARVGHPVVRQYQQEFVSRVALLVDTFVPWRWKPVLRRGGRGLEVLFETRFVWGYDREMLEANLSMAAAVADCLTREECVVDLFAAGPQLYHFESGRSLAHLENILDILACLDRSVEDPLRVIGPAFHERLRKTSSVVALLLGWDAQRAQFIRSIGALGVEVKVVLIRDPGPEAQMATAAGAIHLTVEQALAGVEEL